MVRERFKEGIVHLKCAKRYYPFVYPFAPDEVVEFFRAHYGPMTRAFASLDEHGQKDLRKELVELWSAHNNATGGGTKVNAEYLEVIATRG